jgi:HlyD family type I secretion membrane fusion protein
LLALKREAVGLVGKQGEIKANISELKQKIGETKLQIIALSEKQRKDLLDELHENQQKIGEMLERQKTSNDILARTEIRAPITGTVMNLKLHTVGGIIKPGEPIMDIVPAHEELVIEAKLSPLDIDVVHTGLYAKVVFSGLSQRNTPRLLGKVTHVSADAIVEQSTNKTFFVLDVEVPAKELKKLGGIALYPGMPAEVMIITKTATPWEYFTTPIFKSFDHAFREN